MPLSNEQTQWLGNSFDTNNSDQQSALAGSIKNIGLSVSDTAGYFNDNNVSNNGSDWNDQNTYDYFNSAGLSDAAGWGGYNPTKQTPDQFSLPSIDTYNPEVTQSTSTGYSAGLLGTPNMIAPSSYTAQDATATNYSAVPQANAVTYSPTKLSEELTGLLNKGGDYMQVARTKALQGMNSRNTANSSMAIGAGHKAAIDSGLPIAQGDTNAMNQAGQYNATAANNVNANNANFENQARQSNANAANQFSLANQSAQNREALDNANLLHGANSSNANSANQFALSDQASINQANRYNATSENEFSLNNQRAINQSSSDFAKANNAASMQNAENNMRLLLVDAEKSLSTYKTDIQRKNALDGIASELVRSGVDNGVFATTDGATNWLSMIGDLYPDMGLSVVNALAVDSASEVV